jgi:hypothetical protein
MKEVIEKISEIQSIIEREVEWPLTDYVELTEIAPMLRVINANLMKLQLVAEEIEVE